MVKHLVDSNRGDRHSEQMWPDLMVEWTGQFAENRFVDGHLTVCSRCRAQVDDVSRVISRLQDLPRIETAPTFTEQVLARAHGLAPAGLEEPADPLRTPEHAKPEWYFLFLYQGLKIVPRIVGVMAPIVGALLLLVLPFIDRNPNLTPGKRLVAIAIGVVCVIGIVAFTIWGWLS